MGDENELTKEIRVRGEPLKELPADLFIPPDALRVFLAAFEGPLDLLLYLIRKQNIDILDIPLAAITEQYMHYVELMQELKIELAGDYLVMAALLAEIKSRMLLPKPVTLSEEEEADPRLELIRRLQQYEQCKQAAEALDELPRQERDCWQVDIAVTALRQHRPQPQVELAELLAAMQGLLLRSELFSSHQVQREPLSIRERMGQILDRIGREQFTPFGELFTLAEGRRGVVVTFMALLELLKQGLIELIQADTFATLFVRSR
ncbi:segregation/condensation protein A [Ectothiorhodospiraceae bacterium BW-2]|nr:segregation/condensation protein A [Ectothiorhodospiraceae bacterium BW-2]